MPVRVLSAVAALLLLPVATTADEDQLLREARSDNRRFLLEIKPARPGDKQRCSATLSESNRGRKRDVWTAPLVNDVAPVHAVVRDDGRYLVTLDEFRVGGARNAVVIYGEKGQLLRHFILTDLLGRADWRYVRPRERAIPWLRRADFGFTDDGQFVIALAWKREIHIDLKTLQVLPDGAEAGETRVELPAEILAALFGDDEQRHRQEALAEVARRTGMSVETLEKLAALGYLNLDKASESARAGELDGQTGERRASAADLVSKAEPDRSGSWEPPAAERQPEDRAPATVRDDAAADPDRASPLTDVAGVAALDIPTPDPRQPVDYLAWLNDWVGTYDSEAAPLFQQAMEIAQTWDGDRELLNAAVSGDPQALATPEIQAWLDANEAAVRRFREATHYDFNGFPIESPGGDMIGAVLPSLTPMRNLGRATIAGGRRLAAEGKVEQAFDRYVDALAAGGEVGNGATLIENLVGQRMQSTAAQAVLDLVAADHDGRIDYVAAAESLEAAYRPTRPIAEAVQFERAAFLDSVQRIFEPDPSTGRLRVNAERAREYTALSVSPSLETPESLRRLSAVTFEETVAEANAYYDAVTEAASLPYRESYAMMQKLSETVSSEATNPLLQSLAPALHRVRFMSAHAEADRRATTLVANIEAHRQRFGQYPDSLDSFAGRDFAADPFTDAPFMYQRTDNGFLLYSLGGDGRDDGGVHDASGEQYDLVFWPRPTRE